MAQPEFKEYTTKHGEVMLYTGTPDCSKLDLLATGPGDLWHSSFEQGYKNAFTDIVFFTATFWWYVNDFDNLEECVSWRINPDAFVIRKKVWEQLDGFDPVYGSSLMQALDFGYNGLRVSGMVPLYVKGLYKEEHKANLHISTLDRYLFYRRNFKTDHSLYMLFRKGFWKLSEWKGFFTARKQTDFTSKHPVVTPRNLKEIKGNPTVSYIIPTMLRQKFTLKLMEDIALQTYLPKEVVIVDATPEKERDESLYQKKFPFKVIVKWQTTKGSCRARNEAIDLCTGDYIIFGDDDIRILPDFIENHIALLQTYNAIACNGLDVMAEHLKQNLTDLKSRLDAMGEQRWIVGATRNFSNANSCVRRDYVNLLKGNDINYDGGYGEDGDFGLSLVKWGATVLYNPFSANLHLKPLTGGYRWWGTQAKILGKKRKQQPWELDSPVKWIRPVPSPTIMYLFYKHYTERQRTEYKYKYFFLYLFKKNKWTLPLRILKTPFKLLQFKKSQFYAKKLMELGIRHK
ncbi:glycosyltransferase [uncultured Planktosalinus sp.]|uniref:glycosyltransferase family 2 protein n=1 Tax=uncultured Planktosalinus sp. TaxID=1810935 RepID=UPI0030DB8F49